MFSYTGRLRVEPDDGNAADSILVDLRCAEDRHTDPAVDILFEAKILAAATQWQTSYFHCLTSVKNELQPIPFQN